jgi:hypothetical protein
MYSSSNETSSFNTHFTASLSRRLIQVAEISKSQFRRSWMLVLRSTICDWLRNSEGLHVSDFLSPILPSLDRYWFLAQTVLTASESLFLSLWNRLWRAAFKSKVLYRADPFLTSVPPFLQKCPQTKRHINISILNLIHHGCRNIRCSRSNQRSRQSC